MPRQNSDVGAQAGEFFAVAKIAEVQLNSGAQSDPAKSSAITLYNRAAADLAADLPALIRPRSKTVHPPEYLARLRKISPQKSRKIKQQSSTILSLKDSQSGQIYRLQLEFGKRGEYPSAYFQKILIAERVDKKGMRDNAIG